jgi:hypothetical protein
LGWPVRSASLLETMRVTTSAGPPGGNGTIQRMGLDGQADWAWASDAARTASAPIVSCFVFIASSGFDPGVL